MSSTQVVAEPTRFATSSAALKLVMAVTGTVFIGYVFVHMVGNLKVFLGPDDLNHYAAFLRDLLVPLMPRGWVLWGFRLVLGVCLVAHVGCAAVLTRRARAAGRPSARTYQVAWWRSFTSRTMAASGVLLLAFLVFHIMDLTLGTAGGGAFRHPEASAGEVRYYAYENLVASFERPAAALVYVIAMLVLGAHLLHGAWSVIHDLGVTGARTRRWLSIGGTTIAATVVAGNVSIPIAVQLGVVR